MTEERWRELALRHLAGSLETEEKDEVSTLLETSPAFRRILVEESRTTVDLETALGRPAIAIPDPARRRAIPWAPLVLTGLAASLAIMVWFTNDQGPRAGRAGRAGAATSLDGTAIEFLADTAWSTEVVGGRRVVTLASGAATFEVAAGGRALVVETPAGTVRDVGTRFTLRVGGERDPVAAQVEAGAVEFTPKDRGGPFLVAPGAGTVALMRDGTIGEVREREGAASVRPRNHERWTLAHRELRLEPGDWLRTDLRGANALQVRLTNGTELLLGPGTQIELLDPGTIRIDRGEVEVTPGPDVQMTVRAGTTSERTVGERTTLRAAGDALSVLATTPAWLTGWRADDVDRALGSLLARIDGRDVPLEMGYHKVTIDIRDQLCRTVVDSSFINRTDHTLEGVFYFPLPADASVSSFALWIDGDKVEGEIVEKSRARAIYETLLREKKDPGLLEWTGGNVFKARVYPINGEKRVQIGYTQVLPRRGSTYRYRYALDSELLRQHPLQTLEISATISSALPLTAVRCPSHAARLDVSANAARVEVAEKDVRPQGDFTLEIDVTPPSGGLQALSHRRDDEGYFLLFVDAPERDAATARPGLTPEAPARDWIVLADTSASIGGAERAALESFVDALLLAMGPRDRLQLATVDTEVRWLGEGFATLDDGGRERVRAFLDARPPLGWTDLEGAFAAAFARATDGAEIVYVGDGVLAKGELDPGRFVAQLGRLHQGRGRVHAVAVGNAWESLVLEGLAALDQGRGTVRHLAADGDAHALAQGLVDDVLTPGLDDLRFSVEGLDVAAVHPERLGALRAGEQAVVVGRFDPRLATTPGRAVITARDGESPVRFETALSLAGDDAGDSFIPRLWARQRLDHLLRQGTDAAIREAVIALSERFQIITPYTSFLVIEDAEDRKRFQLEKRLRIRDGEEFFTQGRDDADFELRRRQMLVAKGWRDAQRGALLARLADRGRSFHDRLPAWTPSPVTDDHLGGSWGDLGREGSSEALKLGTVTYTRDFDLEFAQGAAPARTLHLQDALGDDDDAQEQQESGDWGEPTEEDSVADTRNAFAPHASRKQGLLRQAATATRGDDDGYFSLDKRVVLDPARTPNDPVAALFPRVPAPPTAQRPDDWTAAARDAISALDRRRAVRELDGGIIIAVTRRVARPGKNDERVRVGEWLLDRSRFWTATGHEPGSELRYDWFDGKVRGALAETWRLGRIQPARDGDADGWTSPVPYLFEDLARLFTDLDPRLVDLDEGRTEAQLTSAAERWTLVFDATRALLLEVRAETDGLPAGRTTFEDPVAIGAVSYPRRVVRRDEHDQILETLELSYATLDAAAFETQLGLAQKRTEGALVLTVAEPRSQAAMADAFGRGEAGLAELLALLGAALDPPQPARARALLDALDALPADGIGARRIRLLALQMLGLTEEARHLVGGIARGLASVPRSSGVAAARDVLAVASSLGTGETLTLTRTLAPVFTDANDDDLVLEHELRVADALRRAGYGEDAFDQLVATARRRLDDVALRSRTASEMAARGDLAAGLALLHEARASLTPADDAALRRAEAGLLETHGRHGDALAVHEAWDREAPAHRTAADATSRLRLLFMTGRFADAEALIASRIAAPIPSGAPHHELLAQQAAVAHLLGAPLGHTPAQDRRWAAPLAALVKSTFDDRRYRWLRDATVGHTLLLSSPAGRALRAAVLAELEAGVDTRPYDELVRRHRWLSATWQQLELEADPLPELARRIALRWCEDASAGDDADRSIRDLAAADSDLRLRCARTRLARATDPWRVAATSMDVLTELLTRPWTEAEEAEVLAIVVALRPVAPTGYAPSAPEIAALRMRQLVGVVDWMVQGRVDARLRTHPENESAGPRRRRTITSELRKVARSEAATRLQTLQVGADEPVLRSWVALERLDLLALSGRASAGTEILRVFQDALARYREARPRVPSSVAVLVARAVEAALATALDDEPTRLALAALLDEERARPNGYPDADAARYHLLLLADDVPVTRAWLEARVGAVDTHERATWVPPLAALLAAGDDFAAAVTVLERKIAVDDGTPADWLRLAEMRAVLDQQAAAERAELESYRRTPTTDLMNRLNQERWSLPGGGAVPPESVSRSAPLRFRAALEGNPNSSWVVSVLTDWYRATRDFRLLETLAEVMLGESPERAYGILEHLSGLADTVQEEATLDRFRAHVAALRTDGRAPHERRALDLLEAMMLRPAIPTGAADRVTELVRRAGSGEFAEHEPRRLADVLAILGDGGAPSVRAAIEDVLVRLQAAAAPMSETRAMLAAIRGHLLARWDRIEEAAAALGQAIEGRRTLPGGLLAADGRSHLDRLVQIWRNEGRTHEAEVELTKEIERPYPAAIKDDLLDKRFGVYIQALRDRTETSLGEGADLYEPAREALLAHVAAAATPARAQATVQLLINLDSEAIARDPRHARRNLQDLAHRLLPELLQRFHWVRGQQLVSSLASALENKLGHREALLFLVERAENEPAWLAWNNDDFWGDHGWRFTRVRTGAGKTDGPLEARVLAIAVRELTEHALDARWRDRDMFTHRDQHFWREKRDVFVATILDLVKRHDEAEAPVRTLASFLADRLGVNARAIDVLTAFDRRAGLTWDGRLQLAVLLRSEKRHAEARPHDERLVRERPASLDAAVGLIETLAALGDQPAAIALVAKTEARLREDGADAASFARLAQTAFDGGLNESAVALYRHAIDVVGRQPQVLRWSAGWLDEYHRQLSRALARLGKTAEAVDAAAAALVLPGRDQGQRSQSVDVLRAALTTAPDLDRFMRDMEKNVAATGLENPILRRELGQVLLDRGRSEAAVAQLRIALDVAPEDAETRRRLVLALDAAGHPGEATESLRQSAALAARDDLTGYLELAARYAAAGQQDAAERARTTLVERAPLESAGHAALAELRERAGRNEEALAQWSEVARLKEEEPLGLIGRARTLIALGRVEDARAAMREIAGKKWPDHVAGQLELLKELRRRLED